MEFNDIKICIAAPFIPSIGGMTTIAEMQLNHLKKEGARVCRVKTKTKTPFKLIVFIKLFRAAQHCDIIHAHCSSYWGFLPSIMAVMTGKIFNKKVIITYHGGNAEDFLKRYNFIIKPFLNRVDTIIVPSGFLGGIFRKFGYESKIIPNIINLDIFKYNEKTTIKPKLIVTRHLKKIYNIESAIRAFEIVKMRYPDAELKIVGDGDQRVYLENLVRELNLTDVLFTGSIKNEDMMKIYESSDIFLNPTTVDNFPVSVIEAFACGLPVVSTNVGGIPHIIEDGHNGLLVEPKDYEAMAKKIIYLIEQPEKALRLAKCARNVIDQNYSWEKIKQKLICIYT